MPSCPLCRAEFPQMTGLRLFDSANECAICFENCAEMIALFCGHQFCRQDLETLGFVIPQVTQVCHQPQFRNTSSGSNTAQVQAQPAQVQAQPAQVQAQPAQVQAQPAQVQAQPAQVRGSQPAPFRGSYQYQ